MVPAFIGRVLGRQTSQAARGISPRDGVSRSAAPWSSFHDLRHACGSRLIQQGFRPKDVQMIPRPAKPSTMMDLYVHSYDADLRDAVGRARSRDRLGNMAT
jgi:integrase